MPVIPNAGSWGTWNTSELSCESRIGDPRSEATGVTARLDCQTAAPKPKQIDTTSLGLGRFRLPDIATRHANSGEAYPITDILPGCGLEQAQRQAGKSMEAALPRWRGLLACSVTGQR